MADLTGLIAAHWTWHEVDEDGSDHIICACGTTYHNPQRWAEHLKFVVEQHTNGRMTELEARVDEWSADLRKVVQARDEWRARAEKAEATIARVEEAVAGLPACDKYGPDDVISCGWKHAVADVRAALEGEQQ